MYCIAVLAVDEKEGQDYAKYIIDYCTERSIFPLVELYQNQESFFEQIQKTVPAVVLLALPGVSGLNAAEHLRSLYPGCGVIWCSDLDFRFMLSDCGLSIFYGTCGRAEDKRRFFCLAETQ